MPEKRKDRPRHLGRGLESLLGPITLDPEEKAQLAPGAWQGGNFPPDNDLRESLTEIELDAIDPNPYQVRTVWDEEQLEQLAESIRANGVIQPVIVRPAGNRYQLIAGERRFRAAKMAGLTTIPAMVRQANDEQMHEWALVENIHRTDLNPIERAQAYQKYITAFSLTQAEAAKRLGEGRSVVANYLRLLDLPEEIKQMLVNGQLTMGHARALLALPTDELRRKLANRAMVGRLSVREIERLVRRYLTGKSQPRTRNKTKPPHIVDLEDKLGRQLGTRVTIETNRTGRKGRITIEFYSLEDFDRITERLGITCTEELLD